MRKIDLRALALDAYGYASHNVKKCPGIFYKGGCEGRGRPVPGYVYCAKCMRANEANESKAKDAGLEGYSVAELQAYIKACEQALNSKKGKNVQGVVTGVEAAREELARRKQATDLEPIPVEVGAKDAVVEKYRGYEIEEGETGAVRVVGLGHRYAQYFKGWSRASAVEAAKRAIDRELAKPEPLPVKPEDIIRSMYTDRVPGKAKDAKTEIYKGVEIGEVPDSRGKWYVKDPASGQHLKMPDKFQAMGWAEAYERKKKGQEPNHMYDEGRSATAQVGAKDDREYPMPVHRLTGRNPDRCAQCGRPQSDLIHNCTNRFATDRRAKDQVPQDCFDAQILGV